MKNNHHLSNINVLILAAGQGKRLRPLTEKTPKPLIQLHDKFIIEHHLCHLSEFGVKQVFINRDYLSHRFEELLTKERQHNIQIKYFDEPAGALETAGALINVFQQTNSSNLLVINGDIWCDYPFSRLFNKSFSDDISAHLVMVENPDHNMEGDFAINKANILKQKLITEPSYTYAGIGLYRRSFFEAKLIDEKPVKSASLKPFLLRNMTNNSVSGEVYKGNWFDIGTMQRLQQAREYLQHK